MRAILFVSAAFAIAAGAANAQDASPAGDAEAGAKVFKRCKACHQVGPDAKNGVGPSLNGIVGRASATLPDYNYSPAMKNAALVWDEPTLTTYLRAPRKLVPGTRMTFAGLKKDQDIANAIAYLKQFDTRGQQRDN